MSVEWLVETVRNEIISLIGFLGAAFVYWRKTRADTRKEKQALRRQIAGVLSDARNESTRLLVRIGDLISQAERERETCSRNPTNFPADYLDQIDIHLGNLHEMLKRRRAGMDKLRDIESASTTHDSLIATDAIADSVKNDYVFIQEIAEWNKRANEERSLQHQEPNSNR